VLHTETSRSFRSVWKIAHDMGFEEQLLIRGLAAQPMPRMKKRINAFLAEAAQDQPVKS
jgi:hypothetical protein